MKVTLNTRNQIGFIIEAENEAEAHVIRQFLKQARIDLYRLFVANEGAEAYRPEVANFMVTNVPEKSGWKPPRKR